MNKMEKVKDKDKMKLGDVYLVDLPQIGGREQMGKRPAIIGTRRGI